MKAGTFIRSQFMRAVTSPRHRRYLRARARWRRRLKGEGPTVHYFHQVDDPYSHLAVQALGFLRERYVVGFRYHLVPPPGAAYQGDADRFPAWALEDARDISGFYGLEFPADARIPDAGQTLAANGRLVDDLGSESFDHAALETGRRLWSGAEYLQCYLDAAFANGIDITTDDGLRQVMERAGLSWQAAEPQLGKDGWQDELERNLKDLNQAGLWGVPSFRISGGLKSGHFSCWGQDRLWRAAVEIADRAR